MNKVTIDERTVREAIRRQLAEDAQEKEWQPSWRKGHSVNPQRWHRDCVYPGTENYLKVYLDFLSRYYPKIYTRILGAWKRNFEWLKKLRGDDFKFQSFEDYWNNLPYDDERGLISMIEPEWTQRQKYNAKDVYRLVPEYVINQFLDYLEDKNPSLRR